MAHASPLVLGVHGAAGRMGTRIIQLIGADPGLRLGAAIDRPDHPGQGSDVGEAIGLGTLGVPLAATLDRPVDVVIDFSAPAATLALVRACAERHVPLVVGTT